MLCYTIRMARKKEPRQKNPAAVQLARLRAKKLTPKERHESARKAALARWGRKREEPTSP